LKKRLGFLETLILVVGFGVETIHPREYWSGITQILTFSFIVDEEEYMSRKE